MGGSVATMKPIRLTHRLYQWNLTDEGRRLKSMQPRVRISVAEVMMDPVAWVQWRLGEAADMFAMVGP